MDFTTSLVQKVPQESFQKGPPKARWAALGLKRLLPDINDHDPSHHAGHLPPEGNSVPAQNRLYPCPSHPLHLSQNTEKMKPCTRGRKSFEPILETPKPRARLGLSILMICSESPRMRRVLYIEEKKEEIVLAASYETMEI